MYAVVIIALCLAVAAVSSMLTLYFSKTTSSSQWRVRAAGRDDQRRHKLTIHGTASASGDWPDSAELSLETTILKTITKGRVPERKPHGLLASSKQPTGKTVPVPEPTPFVEEETRQVGPYVSEEWPLYCVKNPGVCDYARRERSLYGKRRQRLDGTNFPKRDCGFSRKGAGKGTGGAVNVWLQPTVGCCRVVE
jgi:hypothetical protein